MKNTLDGLSVLIVAAFYDFRRNKVRTFLTSLGIMIGVMSVVLLIALGLGLKNYIKAQFDRLGANIIMVFPGNVFSSESGVGGNFGAGFAGGATFDEKDYRDLKKITEAEYISPVYMKSTVFESPTEKKLGYIMGLNEDSFLMMNIEVYSGEFWGKSDIQARSKVGVIGFTIAEDLFGTADDALGKSVKVGDMRIRIVGVAKKTGDRDSDTSVIIPYTTTFITINPDKSFFMLYLGTTDENKVAIIKEKVKTVLSERYKEDEFSVTEQTEILSTVNQIFTIVNSILIAIGSISLLVGGIGIMNIMYASVTERTKEVGIRRAVGATDHDILKQFLAESVLLSVFGGILGLILSALIVLLIRFFFPASINLFSVVITLVISSAIGIFFGVFPARRAAGLPPIEAIRYE